MAARVGFDEEVARAICAEVATSTGSLRSICKDNPAFPTAKTFWEWLGHKDRAWLRDLYARAKEDQAEILADEILEIADDGRNDWVEKRIRGKEVVLCDKEHIQRSRVRIDSRKWLLSKLKPRKYGDAALIKHAGADGEGPVQVERIDRLGEIADLLRAQPEVRKGLRDRAHTNGNGTP